MNFIEFIGFIVSLLFLLIVSIKKHREDKRRRADPDAYEEEDEEQSKRLKEFLRSIDMDMEEQVPPPPKPQPKHQPVKKQAQMQDTKKPKPHRIVQDQYKFSTKVEERKLETNVEKRKLVTAIEDKYKLPYAKGIGSPDMQPLKETDAYALEKVKGKGNRIVETMKRLPSMKDMIILQEVIGKPKALR